MPRSCRTEAHATVALAGQCSACVARAGIVVACATFAAFATFLAAPPVFAQKAPVTATATTAAAAAAPAPGNDETPGRTPPEQAAAPAAAPAAKAADRRLQGVADERALLGAPSSGRDPYRAALDAHETQQTDLMKAERMPNRALEAHGYDAPPAAGRKPRARMPADAANAPGNVTANTPQDAAQTVYRESFKGPKANAGGQQVYRMPW